MGQPFGVIAIDDVAICVPGNGIIMSASGAKFGGTVLGVPNVPVLCLMGVP